MFIYIVNLVNILGGMFLGWIFLFTGINNLGNLRPRLPYHINTHTILELAAIQEDLTSSGKRKPYQVAIKNNNHTDFVFKKEIPGNIDGKDCRRPDNDSAEEEKDALEIHKMRTLFHKLAILNQLAAPGNPAPKLDLIRRERLEIYGNTEIRGVCMEKLLEGFEEFTENT